jgi:uncharacterized protein
MAKETLDPISIPQICYQPQRTMCWQVQDHLPGLDTLTPVQGQVAVTHQGNYLAVRGQADTITTLTCDRCLCQFNYRLQVDTQELIWLDEAVLNTDLVQELEVDPEDLAETLSPQGDFDPRQWIYEQLCLELPAQQLCRPDCPGIELQSASKAESAALDHRWAILQQLKDQLS